LKRGGLRRELDGMSGNINRDELNEILRKILLKNAALRFFSGLLSFAAVAAWVFAALSIASVLIQEPSPGTTSSISAGVLATLFLAFVIFIAAPLVRLPGPGELASQVEHKRDFKDILTAAYEFSHDRKAGTKYNPALIKEVIQRAVQSILPLQARTLFLGGNQLIFVPLAYGGLIIMMLLSIFSPSTLITAGRIVFEPQESSAPEAAANILAVPGDITVLAGSSVKVTGVDFGRSDAPVNIHYSRSRGFWKSETAGGAKAHYGSEVLKRYNHTFSVLRGPVDYYFESEGRKSPVYHIAVVNKPIVTALKIIRTPPDYTGEPVDTLDDGGGNVQALEGTSVKILGTSNNMLARAGVIFESDKDALTGRAEKHTDRDGSFDGKAPVRHAGKNFEFGFRAVRDNFYMILLEDSSGYKNDDPLIYSSEVFKDHPPSIDVMRPGADSQLPGGRRVEIGFAAADDYGVSKAAIFYRRGSKGKFQTKPIPLDEQQGKSEITKSYSWNLAGMSLFPGNYVEYYLQVEDNNIVTGPGSARSRIYRVSVPTMSDLYDSVAEEDSRRNDLLEQSLLEGKEFKERIEKLSREFKKTEHFDWSQKKEIDKANDAQEKIGKKLDEVKSSLDKTLENLSENKMTSQEIGRKLEEISELVQDINSEVLKKYIEDLQKASSDLTPKDIQKALQNLDVSAQEMLKKLERTAELLKAIRKEQEMEDLVRKSRELMEKQKELLDETGKAQSGDKKKMSGLAEREKNLAKKTSDIEKAVRKFAKKLDKNEQDIAKNLNSSAKKLSDKAVSEKMNQAAKNLSSGDKKQAEQKEKEALEDLVSLFSKMSSCKSSMGFSTGRQQAAHLQKYARQTLDISFKQESLMDDLQTRIGSATSIAKARPLAEDQLANLKAAEKVADQVFEISKQTMTVSPLILQAYGRALSAMKQSIFNLENNRILYSIPSASKALEALNQAAIEMLRAAKSCSSGSGSKMGMQELMDQLLMGQQDMLEQSKEMLSLEMLEGKDAHAEAGRNETSLRRPAFSQGSRRADRKAARRR